MKDYEYIKFAFIGEDWKKHEIKILGKYTETTCKGGSIKIKIKKSKFNVDERMYYQNIKTHPLDISFVYSFNKKEKEEFTVGFSICTALGSEVDIIEEDEYILLTIKAIHFCDMFFKYKDFYMKINFYSAHNKAGYTKEEIENIYKHILAIYKIKKKENDL